MLMSRIDRYIVMQLLGVFGFFALILVAIYWVNRAVGLLDALVSDGQSVGVFLQMSLLTVPSVVELIAPMASFGAAVFVANKLTNDSEMVVLQALGFSYFRLARAALIFGLIVALMMSLVTNFLIPAAASQLRELNGEITRNNTAKYLKEGQFLQPDVGIVLYIREISATGELLDMFISDTRDPMVQQLYTAQRSFVINDASGPKLLMVDGMLQRKLRGQSILSVSRFADFTYSLSALIKDTPQGQRGISELSTLDLLRAGPNAVAETASAVGWLRYTGNLRLSWPITAAFTAMIGFATLFLGAFNRRGLLWQILVATMLLIVLYLVHIITLSRAPAWPNGWILAYATPVLGAVLTWSVLWRAGLPKGKRRLIPAQNGAAR